jgi:DNA repair exonuclease SbcCD ATPase subunit
MKKEISRYRGMIAYARAAPDFASCKSILTDALDGANGAANYEEVKGERETLRAELRHLNAQLNMRVAQAEGYEKMVDAKDAELTFLRAEVERLLQKAVYWEEQQVISCNAAHSRAEERDALRLEVAKLREDIRNLKEALAELDIIVTMYPGGGIQIEQGKPPSPYIPKEED